MDQRHGVANDGVMYPWFGLHVRFHDLHVIAKITVEGVALPVAFGFDDVKGNFLQEVF